MHIKPELIQNTETSFNYMMEKLGQLSSLIGGNEKLDWIIKNLEKSETDFHYLIKSFVDYAGLVESLSLLFTKIISLPASSLKQIVPHLTKLLKDLNDYQEKLFVRDEPTKEEENGDCETHD